MSTFVFRFIFLIGITAAIGLAGTVIHKCLFWIPNVDGKQPNFIFNVSFGTACIILLVTGMGALEISINRNSLSIALGGILLLSLLIIAYKIKNHLFRLPSFHFERESIWIGLFALTIFIAKLIEIRHLLVPNWVDGLIHVTILQKLVLKGVIPADRIYHTGFHAGAIFIHDTFGISLSDTVLLFGQWTSALVSLVFYNFLRRNRIHLVFAIPGAMIYGLVTLFPSYLVTWGRYPFLLGLALLFPSITSTLDWMKGNKHYLEAAIFVCALSLSHYGALMIWFSFLVSHLFIHKDQLFGQKNPYQKWLIPLLLLILPPLVILFPKSINFLGQKNIQAALLAGTGNPDFGGDINFVLSLIQKHDLYILFIFLAMIFYTLILKQKLRLTMLIWPIIVLVLTWAQYIFLGFSVTSYINVIIFASGPIIILSVYSIQHIFIQWRRSHPIQKRSHANLLNYIIPGALFLVLTIVGISSSQKLISSDAVLFTDEDSTAMEWIKTHTPKDATFLIQSFVWGNQLMPSDAGGWIPILTGRKTVYPKEIGEFHSVSGFMANNDVDYLYFGKEYDPNFTLRLSDIDVPYQIVYQTEHVTILKPDRP